MLNFSETVFRRRFPFSLRKNMHGKFAEKFGEKIRRIKIVFHCFFSLCFSLFSSHPILRATFYLQTEKIRTESALREISLNVSPFDDSFASKHAKLPLKNQFVLDCAHFMHSCCKLSIMIVLPEIMPSEDSTQEAAQDAACPITSPDLVLA